MLPELASKFLPRNSLKSVRFSGHLRLPGRFVHFLDAVKVRLEVLSRMWARIHAAASSAWPDSSRARIASDCRAAHFQSLMGFAKSWKTGRDFSGGPNGLSVLWTEPKQNIRSFRFADGISPWFAPVFWVSRSFRLTGLPRPQQRLKPPRYPFSERRPPAIPCQPHRVFRGHAAKMFRGLSRGSRAAYRSSAKAAPSTV